MTDITNKEGSSGSLGWSAKLFETLKTILDGFFVKFPMHEEMTAFMNDDKRMYDKDGKPSVEYNQWIQQFNEFCKENPLEDTLMDTDPNLNAILKGAREFLTNQNKMREDYRSSQDKKKWLDTVFDSSEKKDAFEILIENSISKGLKDVDNVKS